MKIQEMTYQDALKEFPFTNSKGEPELPRSPLISVGHNWNLSTGEYTTEIIKLND